MLVMEIVILLFSLLFSGKPSEPAPGEWLHLEPGLQLAEFPVHSDLEGSEGRIVVLSIDPEYFNIGLFSASALDKKNRTPRQWSERLHLVAAINAGMYATDYLTSVGYLKSGEHLNNPHMNSSYNCIFACDPLEEGIPPVQIIDRECSDFEEWKDKYRSFVQNIRMISCQGENVWEQQARRYSIAAAAIDSSGHLLLIHSRPAYSVHNFINILLDLPLNIRNAMYLEGGMDAGLFVGTRGYEREYVGNRENTFFLNEENADLRPLPNIIGIRRKN
ncbi:MAG: phosphodiester glycosidase family protein [Calditrichia bacterium]